MQKYVIEREIPEAGSLSARDLQGISHRSCVVLKELGPHIHDICLERARAFRFLLPVAPEKIRHFVDAIHIIRDAYYAGDLTYSVITARKRDDAGVPQPCRSTPVADVRL